MNLLNQFIEGFKMGYAEAKARSAARDPHDRMIRKILKWLTVLAAVLTFLNLRLALGCGFWLFL